MVNLHTGPDLHSTEDNRVGMGKLQCPLTVFSVMLILGLLSHAKAMGCRGSWREFEHCNNQPIDGPLFATPKIHLDDFLYHLYFSVIIYVIIFPKKKSNCTY